LAHWRRQEDLEPLARHLLATRHVHTRATPESHDPTWLTDPRSM